MYNADSKHLLELVEKESVDFCVTSPPYWDILNMKRSADKKVNVNYSESLDDLGNIKDYSEFNDKLGEVFSQVHSVLKDGKYCVVIVMDIRKGKVFYPFHYDVSEVMKRVGFELRDIIIWDRQNEYNNMRPLGFPYSFVVNKIHEYLLIFRKV
ncbi:MAG: DNA methyltransferase [Thermoplasmataceae archaeon]